MIRPPAFSFYEGKFIIITATARALDAASKTVGPTHSTMFAGKVGQAGCTKKPLRSALPHQPLIGINKMIKVPDKEDWAESG